MNKLLKGFLLALVAHVVINAAHTAYQSYAKTVNAHKAAIAEVAENH